VSQPGPDRAAPKPPSVPWASTLVPVGGAALLIMGLGLGFGLDGAASLAMLCAAALGGALGASELAARYTDNPLRAVRSLPGAIYLAVNALAGLAAFVALHAQAFPFFGSVQGGSEAARLVAESVIAGLGAMAVMRSAVFSVRSGGTDVAVGPAAVLQVILSAIDRAVDRERAKPRAEWVSARMHSVSFDRSADILSAFCLDAMQNVSPEERQRFNEWLGALKARKDRDKLSDDQLALLVGLRLLNIVGEDVLSSTIAGLGSRIRGKLEFSPTTTQLLAGQCFEEIWQPLVEASCSLSRTADHAVRQNLREEAERILGLTACDNDTRILLLAHAVMDMLSKEDLDNAVRMVVKLAPPDGSGGGHASPAPATPPTVPSPPSAPVAVANATQPSHPPGSPDPA